MAGLSLLLAPAAWAQSGNVTINFDGLAAGAIVTNQYSAATFASPTDSNFVRNSAGYNNSPPHFICTTSCTAGTTVTFPAPVRDLRFKAIGVHNTAAQGQVAAVDVYELGELSATVSIVGRGDSTQPMPVDLSAYHGVTRIVIRNITDTRGIGWDDFTFAIGDYQCDEMPAPDEVIIYEHAGYQGRCVVKQGPGRYDADVEFAPLPDDSASSIRVGDDLAAVLASEIKLDGDREKFTGDDADFRDNGPIPGEELIGDDRMSSFKVQLRPSDAWEVVFTAGKPKRWVGEDGIVLTAALQNRVTEARVPGQVLSFDFTTPPATDAYETTCVAANCTTDERGRVSWKYEARTAGIDRIVAYYDQDANGRYDTGEPHAIRSVEWSYARYLALGDSFSSGEGIYDYEPGTADRTNRCHRSLWQRRLSEGWRTVWSGAYSGHIAARLRVVEGGALGFFACSGARIADVMRQWKWNEPPQIQRVRPFSPDLITMTIGGNDAHFADVVKDCIVSDPSGCHRTWDEDVREAIYDMESPGGQIDDLKDVYVRLKKEAPNARLLIVGYPHLFESPAGTCMMSGEVADWMNAMTDELNFAIQRSVEEATLELRGAGLTGVEYVHQADTFRGHELCSGDSWVILAKPPEGFHPWIPGQQALADRVWPAITGR